VFVITGGIAIIRYSALGNEGYVANLRLAPHNEKITLWVKELRGINNLPVFRGSGAQGVLPSVFGGGWGLYV
jgi:hypothetical protein